METDEGGLADYIGGTLTGLLSLVNPVLGTASAPIINMIAHDVERQEKGNWKAVCTRICVATAVSMYAALAANELTVKPPPIGGGGHHVHPPLHER